MHYLIRVIIFIFTLLSPATARLAGFQAPATIAAGLPFQVSLLTAGYIQPVYDVAVVFGITSRNMMFGQMGTVIGSNYLGPDRSNTRDTLNFTVTTDRSSMPGGNYTLSATVMSVYGVGGMSIIESWNVTVVVGEATSTDTVESLERTYPGHY